MNNTTERMNLVLEFCKENPKPVQHLCPEINQYFPVSKGYAVWNSRTWERETVSDIPSYYTRRDHNYVAPRSYAYKGFYVRYVESLDALEIATVYLDGRRGQDGIGKTWHYDDGRYEWENFRVFLFHDDANAYYSDGEVLDDGRYYSKLTISKINSCNSNSLVDKRNYDEFQKFSDANVKARGWGDCKTPYPWMYAEWYRLDFMKRNVSKNTQKVMAYKLDNVEFERNTNVPCAIYFQKLDDNFAVLRTYVYESTYDYSTREYVRRSTNGEEKGRLFISSKGKATYMTKEAGNWKVKSKVPYRESRGAEFINPISAMEFTALKYIMPCIDVETCSIQDFINILRHPIIEQLVKAGYSKVAQMITFENKIAANLREFFFVEKETKQPMFKLLKVNKFVLKSIEESGTLETARQIKRLCDDYDATKVGEELCNNIAAFTSANPYSANLNNLVYNDEYVHGDWYMRRCHPEYFDGVITGNDRDWIIRLVKMNQKNSNCLELYKDVITTYRSLDNKPEIDLYNVHNYNDIQRLHDALIELKMEQDRERRRMWDLKEEEREKERMKKFEKLQEDRIKKFEWECGDYCIRVPHNLGEITKEGLSLHHCVGGYLDSHANGNTNIIFLRRKDSEDTPFYTIEISPDNRVVQIHGFGNRWLGNDPDAVPFVYTYLITIGAYFNNDVLLNKSTGYCPSSDRLDESYLKEVM